MCVRDALVALKEDVLTLKSAAFAPRIKEGGSGCSDVCVEPRMVTHACARLQWSFITLPHMCARVFNTN